MDSLASAPMPVTASHEFMVFRLGTQEFAISVACVSEVRRYAPASRLPHADPFVLGVINLRGVILPIVDLGARLGLAPSGGAAVPIVVIVSLEKKLLGLLVDAVCDIVAVMEEALGPAPAVDDDAIRELVKAVITVDGRMIGLVAPELVLSGGDGAVS